MSYSSRKKILAINVQVARGTYLRNQIQQVPLIAKTKQSFIAKFLRKLNSWQAKAIE